jgi:hypothetical protein
MMIVQISPTCVARENTGTVTEVQWPSDYNYNLFTTETRRHGEIPLD